MKTKIMYIIPLLALMISSFNSNSQNRGATLGGMSGGTATAEQLSKDSVLMVDGAGIEVTSFRMSAYAKDKDALEIESSNARLTTPMRKAIAEAPPGTKIYFEFIRAKNSKGDSLKLSPLAFTIK